MIANEIGLLSTTFIENVVHIFDSGGLVIQRSQDLTSAGLVREIQSMVVNLQVTFRLLINAFRYYGRVPLCTPHSR